MSRITGSEVANMMEAYGAVYTPSFTTSLNNIYIPEEVSNLFEGCLTEEFISEAYHTVADYLVSNGFVPGHNTAELFMSEMVEEDIDAILFETGVLDEQYLLEAGFFQGLGAGADRFVGGVARGVQRAGQTVSGAAQRAGQTAVRAGQAAAGAAQRAGQAVSGGVQRAGQAAVRAATPVAQAVKGTAQRAVAAGQSALGSAGRAIQGAAQGAARGAVAGAQGAVRGATAAGQAVAGAAQRAGSAVAGAAGNVARKVGQEVEISRRVGAGLPPTAGGGAAGGAVAKTTPQPVIRDGSAAGKPGAAGGVAAPKPVTPSTAINAAPKTSPAASGSVAKPTAAVASSPTTGTTPVKPAGTPPTPTQATAKKPSMMQQSAELRQMRAASQQRTMAQGGTPATPLVQSFDPFDVVMGHLIDEGYAETEEAALAIMANMSEEWRESIVESAIAQRAAAVVDDQRSGSHGMADDLNKTRKSLDKMKPYPNGFPNAAGVKGA